MTPLGGWTSAPGNTLARPRTVTRRALLLGAATVPLAACGAGAERAPRESGPGGPAPGADPSGIAITHVHTVNRDPASGRVLLATHQGLFAVDNGELTLIGPGHDLMGFTIAPDGTYLASGHPATADLPQPLGLIASTNQGKSWTPLSRAGQSDFHTLSATARAVLGFDGTLRVTTDRKVWRELAIPAPPRDLAAGPTGTVLATTEQGLLASMDDGSSWTKQNPPELALAVTWADPRTVVCATPAGRLMVTRDAGITWQSGPRELGEVQSMSARIRPSGEVEVLLVSGTTLLRTTDQGATTTRIV